LCYIHRTGEAKYERKVISKERLPSIFSQAFQTIRDHPLLANVKHLHIRGGNIVAGNLELVTHAVGRLFGTMGPLKNLILDGCDLRSCLDPFLDAPLFSKAIHPTSFPPIKSLTIINPVQSFYHDKVYAAAIVAFVRSQYMRRMPFERVDLHTRVPPLMIDELGAFVDTVECGNRY